MNRNRTVFCIGESLLDIIFSPDGSVDVKPGGSLLNTAVSLARSGIDVHLISEFFQDDPGKMIQDFLKENNVSKTCSITYNSGNTPLALAFLNRESEASYTFYKSYPGSRFDQQFPVPGKDDIVCFGSFFSLVPEIHEKLNDFLRKARENHSLNLYDPNFRKSHQKDLQFLLPLIRNNISQSDIIRGSHEDFLHIFATNNPDEAFIQINDAGGNCLIWTRNREDVYAISSNERLSVHVPAIEPISTIGAGDSFNAGLIYGLMVNNIRKDNFAGITSSDLNDLVSYGILFSQEVCLNTENYISKEFIHRLK